MSKVSGQRRLKKSVTESQSRRGCGGTVDALGLGPSESNLVGVQILSPAPVRKNQSILVRLAEFIPTREGLGD